MWLSEKALYFQKKPLKRCHHSERDQRDALRDQLCLCGPISKLKIRLNCGKATGSALTVYRIPNWPQLSSQECIYPSRKAAFETVCVQVGSDTLKTCEFVGGGCSHCGKEWSVLNLSSFHTCAQTSVILVCSLLRLPVEEAFLGPAVVTLLWVCSNVLRPLWQAISCSWECVYPKGSFTKAIIKCSFEMGSMRM